MQSTPPPKAWRVTQVVTQPRIDGSGHARDYLKVTYYLATRGYTGTLFLPATTADEETVRAAVQADVDRVDALYNLASQ